MTERVLSVRCARRAPRLLSLLILLVAAGGCGNKQLGPPAGTAQPDRFLFDRGNETLKEEQWLNARTYFQQIVDNYPQSPLRPDAKLGMGDSYLGESSAESAVLAANEFREFLQFYPTNMRADYAQYKLAMSHFGQMRAPERDQTETRESLREFDVFFLKYPSSPLTAEVKQNWRIARDRLSEASFRVGLTYYRQRWYPGAISRFREVLAQDPGYTGKDALYFYLADSLSKTDKNGVAEAIPYFERLIAEFDQSAHIEDAKKRLQELKNQ